MQQYRPKGTSDPMYAPYRDLAYCYAPALREALLVLGNDDNWPDWFRQFATRVQLTAEDLRDGGEKLLAAHELFVGDLSIKQPIDALRRAGFLEVPTAVRILLFMQLGEVIMGGFFVAIRDVTQLDQPPPEECGMEELLYGGREFSTQLSRLRDRMRRPAWRVLRWLQGFVGG